jgi:hypothetical protein
MFLIYLLLITLLVFSAIASANRSLFKINLLISVLLLIILLGFVSYTPDWLSYQNFFSLNNSNQEIGFEESKKLFKSFNLEYKDLHLAYVSIYAVLLSLLVYRFERNIVLVLMLYLPINFLFITTQVRFFLAYFLVITGFYYLIILKQSRYSFVFFVLGLLSHYSMVLLAPFYFLSRFSIKVYTIRIIYFSASIFAVFLVAPIIFLRIGISKQATDAYLSASAISSFLGGVYIFIPSMLISLINHRIFNAIVIKRPELVYDIKFEFLYKMSYYPYLFLGVAFFIQIVGHRFIFSGLLFQFLLLLYISRFESGMRPRLLLYSCIYSLFFFLYIYVLPGFFLNGTLWQETVKTFNSNRILNSLKL